MKKLWKFIKTTYLCIRFPFVSCSAKTYCWYDAIPKGWRKAFGIQLFKEIKQSLKRGGKKLSDFNILDIKEKYGQLSIYESGSTTEVHKILMKYEYISEHTCIHCGRPATVTAQDWISPYCDDCVQKQRVYAYIDFGTKENPWYGWTGNINNRKHWNYE